jgi:hypothetical protein
MPGLSSDDLDLLTTIATRHATLLAQLREALEADDATHALELAREICGMTKQPPNEWHRRQGALNIRQD